jgi:hypothetical protein
MKLVKEDINEFEKGADPYKSMGVGSHREKIQVQLDHDELSTYGRLYVLGQGGHGSFHTALFKCFGLGGQDNRRKIADAFPEYFNEYDITMYHYKEIYKDEYEG